MGVGHGLWYAAVGVEVDSLDVGHSFQVDFVNCRFRFVKDEAKPATENMTLKSPWRQEKVSRTGKLHPAGFVSTCNNAASFLYEISPVLVLLQPAKRRYIIQLKSAT